MYSAQCSLRGKITNSVLSWSLHKLKRLMANRHNHLSGSKPEQPCTPSPSDRPLWSSSYVCAVVQCTTERDEPWEILCFSWRLKLLSLYLSLLFWVCTNTEARQGSASGRKQGQGRNNSEWQKSGQRLISHHVKKVLKKICCCIKIPLLASKKINSVQQPVTLNITEIKTVYDKEMSCDFPTEEAVFHSLQLRLNFQPAFQLDGNISQKQILRLLSPKLYPFLEGTLLLQEHGDQGTTSDKMHLIRLIFLIWFNLWLCKQITKHSWETETDWGGFLKGQRQKHLSLRFLAGKPVRSCNIFNQI